MSERQKQQISNILICGATAVSLGWWKSNLNRCSVLVALAHVSSGEAAERWWNKQPFCKYLCHTEAKSNNPVMLTALRVQPYSVVENKWLWVFVQALTHYIFIFCYVCCVKTSAISTYAGISCTSSFLPADGLTFWPWGLFKSRSILRVHRSEPC